jgi:hypothetical protein
LGILIFKGFAARRLYKSFGVKGLITSTTLADRITHQVATYISKTLRGWKNCRDAANKAEVRDEAVGPSCPSKTECD